MRFAVIGNCQAAGFADCLRVFLPKAETVLFDLTALAATGDPVGAAAAIGARLPEFSHVFAHPVHGARFGPLEQPRLAASGLPVWFIPTLAFQGFHPDCVYLFPPGKVVGGEPFRGPLDVYHSAIAACGFLLGLPVERTVRLYNPLVFGRLGFAEAHETAVAQLVRHYRELGHDITERLPLWSRPPGSPGRAFMHTINHPTLRPVADTCRMVAAAAGLGEMALEEADVVPDRLADLPVFPVYPGHARRLGITGHLRFRTALRQDRGFEVLDLETFVARSHAAYAAAPEALAAAVGANPVSARILDRLPKLLDRAAPA
jgi:hypothetical protein